MILKNFGMILITKKSNLYFKTIRDCGNAVSLVFIEGDFHGKQREEE